MEADVGAGVVVRGTRVEGSGGGGRGLVVRAAVVVAGEVAEGGVVWTWTWRGGV